MNRFTILFAALAIFGCSAELGTGNYDPDDPRLETALLEVVPPSTFNLRFEEEADLEVFYHFDDGEPISGAPVEFAIEGPAGDASLAGRIVDTGSDGHATMRLRAGLENTRFTVTATPPVGEPVSFLVAINDEDAGSIVVEMSYAGEQDFDGFTPYLFDGGDCASLDPEMLPMAERIGAPVPRVIDRPGFAGVPTGTDWVVAVVADIAGEPAGFGCTVGVEVRRGEETPVPVTILDVEQSVRFEGVYDLRNTFDFGGGLPDSVDTALNILDELTDDQNIDGDAATEDWGQDPGAFVTDIVMRQTCHWECMGGEDYDTCSEINHRLGDLELLYTRDFTSWSGAQSRFFGGCGAWEVAGRTAQNWINDQIGTYVPEIVLRFLDSAGDLSRAITMSQIQSVLTLEPEADGMIPMTHELVTMEVVLRDLGGASHTAMIDLSDAGVMRRTATSAAMSSGDELLIPAHTFQIHFGELIQYIYLNHLLPLFGFSSTADMLMEWIDCDAVAAALYMTSDLLSESTYRSACVSGVEAAGDFVDDRIAGLIDEAAVFTISGNARAAELSTEGIAQRLEMGLWTGSWDEAGTSMTIDGTFVGMRR